MACISNLKGNNAIMTEVARAFLDSTRLRKWVGVIEESPTGAVNHIYTERGDVAPRLQMGRFLEPGVSAPVPMTSCRRAEAKITTFKVLKEPGGLTANEVAKNIGRCAANWMDGKVTKSLVAEMPFKTPSIEVSKSGISKRVINDALNQFIEDKHPMKSKYCMVLPNSWSLAMSNNHEKMSSSIYKCEPFGDVEVVFRPECELCHPVDGNQRGVVFMNETLMWAENGWLCDFARASLKDCSDQCRNIPVSQIDWKLFDDIFQGGAAVAKVTTGVVELVKGD